VLIECTLAKQSAAEDKKPYLMPRDPMSKVVVVIL